MNLLLLNYNNYFNRQLKKTNIDGYYALKPKTVTWTGEFNHNDGVNTSVVLSTDNVNYDYLVVVDDSNKIVSRWFIHDSSRVSKGKYRCELKRDLIADYYLQIVDSPCFIEKGWVPDSSPLIFNKEDFDCNQIKVGECLIRDKSKISWLAIYYNLSQKNQLSGSVKTYLGEYIAVNAPDIDSWDIIARYGTNGYNLYNTKIFKVKVNNDEYLLQDSEVDYISINDEDFYVDREKLAADSISGLRYQVGPKYHYSSHQATVDAIKECIESNRGAIQTALENDKKEFDSFENFIKWNDKVVKTNDNNYYRIKIQPVSGQITDNGDITSGALFNVISGAFKVGGEFKEGFSGDFDNAFNYSYKRSKFSISYEPVTDDVETLTFDFTGSHNELVDEPFGLMLLPYKPFDQYGRKIRYNLEEIPEDLSLLIAQELCKKGVGPSSVIYDVQLLPYCALDINCSVNTKFYELYSNDLVDSKSYVNILGADSRNASFALFPKYSKFTKNVDITSALIAQGMNVEDEIKVENQCTFFRLCSPNYNGQFELSRAKNLGISSINIDCTYKPYQPYIHLNPVFKGLYGQDFNDARGLICGGDFSISVVTDAFEQYKIQNKNFQEIFNRQIENMDINYETEKQRSIANLAIQTGKGAVGGAIAGANPYTIALGAATGLVSGVSNMSFQEKSYQENRDYTIDMHNYQLGNIKALPNSLTKVDAYTNNNKIFPVLEMYTCTEEEKEIFRNKLQYEGMTVNAIGKISQYLKSGDETFIKAKPLRILGISEDSHMLYSIYEELEKGYYFTEVTE